MRYRALVGIKGTPSEEKKPKAEREAYHIGLMHTLLRQWDSSVPVPPYYDPSYDTDAIYSQLLQHSSSLVDKVNIDDPLEVMNYIGKTNGHVFYLSIPADDKKNREHRKKEYRKATNKYNEQHKPIPEEIKKKWKFDLLEPKAAPKTKLYAYCVINPNGMFKSYSFPIEHAYNIDVNSSKLVNRNYGTMHDILYLGDFDFEATFLPNVVFRSDGEILESYPEDQEGGDPEEIKEFLFEILDRRDYVAIIECEV